MQFCLLCFHCCLLFHQYHLNLFQNQILNCRNISDAYNKGLIDFRTLLSILKKSQKFKEWLSKSNADQDLLKEYIKEIEKIDFGLFVCVLVNYTDTQIN